MNIAQIKYNNKIVCCIVDGDNLKVINGNYTTYEIAQIALDKSQTMQQTIEDLGAGESLDYQKCLDDNLVTIPIHHPDPAHMYVCGTGLTHLGSADARNKMHDGSDETETDSIKMFRWGVESGKPDDGKVGVLPEWFYKGDGTTIKATNESLDYPNYASDGGDEPEICGIYINDKNGTPSRIGYTMGNEYSDHIVEKQNYLWLAHSKLRQCSLSPELLLGDLPKHIEGKCSVIRNGESIWSKEFLSGEDNMSHTIGNLEHHHFKYKLFCRPGDINVHFFGTATASFADGIKVEDGDIMEIESDCFGKPLSNPLKVDDSEEKLVKVKQL